MQSPISRRAWLVSALALPIAAAFAVGGARAQVLRDDTRPDDLAASAFQFRIGQPGAFIKVRWARPENVPSSTVLGYTIWRDDFTSSNQVVGGRYGDHRGFVDSESGRTVTAYDGIPGSDEAGSPAQFENVPGIQPGRVYRYQVSSAYNNGLQDRDGDGMADVGAQFMSPLSSFTRRVTAIAPPTVSGINGQSTGGGVQVDPTNFTIEWQQTPGADTYVIWVSADASFRRGKKVFLSEQTVPVNQGGPATATATLSLDPASLDRGGRRRGKRGRGRQVVSEPGTFYVTVGARKVGEPKPRPFGAIFSAPVQLRAEQAPPPPP